MTDRMVQVQGRKLVLTCTSGGEPPEFLAFRQVCIQRTELVDSAYGSRGLVWHAYILMEMIGPNSAGVLILKASADLQMNTSCRFVYVFYDPR